MQYRLFVLIACAVHDVFAMTASSLSSSSTSAPVFSRPASMSSRQTLALAVGESASLPCHARASPTPLIAWYKDDAILDHAISWSLELGHVTLADGALYTCVVYNNVAAISRTYNVTVAAVKRIHYCIHQFVILNHSLTKFNFSYR